MTVVFGKRAKLEFIRFKADLRHIKEAESTIADFWSIVETFYQTIKKSWQHHKRGNPSYGNITTTLLRDYNFNLCSRQAQRNKRSQKNYFLRSDKFTNMKLKLKKQFKIKFLPPGNISAENKWSLQRSYWAHIERMLTAEKMVENDNAEMWNFVERQIEDHGRQRKKKEEKKAWENKKFFKKLKQAEAYNKQEDQIKDWKRNQIIMKHMCKRPAFQLKKKKDILFMQGPQSQTMGPPQRSIPRPLVDFKLRPRCYFDLKIENDIDLGRLTFELYGEYVPKTAANFLSLCKGCDGLTYKGSCLHRINPGLMCQGGDITEFNGSGGMTIFGEVFFKENYSLKHGGMGVLSMTGVSPSKVSSLFNITFRQLHALDGSSVVIGKVVKGINTLLKVEEFGYRTGKPRKKVVVAGCGQL